ncbi:MAG: hypothetical protein K8S87_08290 [Planctomycetes bacterium]|nr:hypothetical protein [Planctomycetota bacterium]
MKSTILQFLLVVIVVFSASANAFCQDNTDADKDKTAIKDMVAKYKEYIENTDAENMLKILSTESVKKIEKVLEDLKNLMKDIPREKQDVEITDFAKTPREILAMDLTSFLKWMLSRLGKYDISDMKDTELTEINVADDGKSALLKWQGENTVEAPKKVLKEDGKWKIEIQLN